MQQTGSGDSAVITKVTWTGGKTPTGEDSLFQFLAQPASAKTYTFQVQQTYSDGSIVELGRDRSPPLRRRRRSRRRARSAAAASSVLAIIALIVGVLGLLAGGFALVSGGSRGAGRWHELRRGRIVAGARASSRSGSCCRAWRRRTRTWSRPCRRRAACSNVPPPNVQLTYDEAVEPRFAIISVTNAAGRQETTGPVHRSPANPDTLVVPLRPHLPEGWYLIYWRAISVDGHPVQGAFTYAVGPNPGPAPQFRCRASRRPRPRRSC